MLVFLFVLNGDGEVALVVDGYAAIFFLDAWSCKFHYIALSVSLTLTAGAVLLARGIKSVLKKSSNIVGNQPLLFINPFNIINTS
jgi:hypothetical protein